MSDPLDLMNKFTQWREPPVWNEKWARSLGVCCNDLAAETRRVENVMAERDRWAGLYSRLQDERAADFEKWFKIINFGNLTPYQAECPHVIDAALRELVLWRWTTEMQLIVQAMASTVPGKPEWVVMDVDGDWMGHGFTPQEAIADAKSRVEGANP